MLSILHILSFATNYSQQLHLTLKQFSTNLICNTSYSKYSSALLHTRFSAKMVRTCQLCMHFCIEIPLIHNAMLLSRKTNIFSNVSSKNVSISTKQKLNLSIPISYHVSTINCTLHSHSSSKISLSKCKKQFYSCY